VNKIVCYFFVYVSALLKEISSCTKCTKSLVKKKLPIKLKLPGKFLELFNFLFGVIP